MFYPFHASNAESTCLDPKHFNIQMKAFYYQELYSFFFLHKLVFMTDI